MPRLRISRRIRGYLCPSARENPTVANFATVGFKWRGPDLNRRPRGYEPRELPGCSTPRQYLQYIQSVSKTGCRFSPAVTSCDIWTHRGGEEVYRQTKTCRGTFLRFRQYATDGWHKQIARNSVAVQCVHTSDSQVSRTSFRFRFQHRSRGTYG